MTPASHSPAARKKAVATSAESRAFAAKYDADATQYRTASDLLKFMKRHSIALNDVPPSIRKRLGKRSLGKLETMKKTNGHARAGIGIPLDAIPERKAKAATGSGVYDRTKAKAHPNAAQIDKVLDLLADANTDKDRGDRLLAALDKLLL